MAVRAKDDGVRSVRANVDDDNWAILSSLSKVVNGKGRKKSAKPSFSRIQLTTSSTALKVCGVASSSQ